MLYTCWSAKGGSGTTVVAALLALCSARVDREVLLVDTVGDLPAALGLPVHEGPGLADWLATPQAPPDALVRLEVPVTDRVTLVPRGSGPVCGGDRLELLAALLAADGRRVVVDAGCVPVFDRAPAVAEPVDTHPSGAMPPLSTPLATSSVAASSLAATLSGPAAESLLVTRPCYLAMRRALQGVLRPTGIVLVDEEARALDERDVAEVLGAPVVAVLPVEPSIARAVDAGLLATRQSRRARRALRALT